MVLDVEISELGTILGVWAHPDDEAYLMGGLMFLAARAGQRVVCVTATRGEAGSQDEERWPPSKMAEIRERELGEALDVLEVKEHVWLDYIDGECHTVDPDEAVSRLAPIVEEVRPDAILTFGPDGQTGHLDHIAVHAWAQEAFHTVAPKGAGLHHAITTPEWMDRFGPALEPYNVFAPGTPLTASEDECSIYVELEGEALDRKVQALKKQVSQTEGLISAFGEEAYRDFLSLEAFVEAARR